MKVVAFNGSPRKDGNTFRLLQHVFRPLQAAGIETDLVQVGASCSTAARPAGAALPTRMAAACCPETR